MPDPTPLGAEPIPGPRKVDVGGYRIWTQVSGSGSPTVVFESGGGDDSTVWASLEPGTRERNSVATFLYDRAGLGQSEPSPGPYRIDEEVRALRTALTARGVPGPLVLVAHSYGSFVSLLAAAEDPRVVGLVLLDGNLPGFFDDREVALLQSRFASVVGELRQHRPDLARVLVPAMEGLRATAHRVEDSPVPLSLPVVDIVAENTWIPTPEEVAAARREHAAFVAASSAREAVFASGSGHYVMRDRPELVADAISRVIDRLRVRT